MKDRTLRCLLYYLLFGTLHETCHLVVGRFLCHNNNHDDDVDIITYVDDILRAVIGRYAVVRLDDQCEEEPILRAGWMGSVLIWLLSMILWKLSKRNDNNDNDKLSLSWLSSPMVYAAFVTAMEAVVTDLFRWIPHHYNSGSSGGDDDYYGENKATTLLAYCGNFGIILLNPAWLNIDGGRTALDVLEKMVEVTMMRGEYYNICVFMQSFRCLLCCVLY